MEFFLKLFKELNSTNSEKLMIISILFGLMSGFLPTFNIITFIIIFIVFIFRIPIGLYFASWSIFSIIGYFLDYIFHKMGLIILNSSILNNLWTALYNTPLLRWSGFNNSITMGAFVGGIVLSIILYFILNKYISLYRNTLLPKIANISYLKWIIPKEEKKGIFRFSGLIVISSIMSIIIIFFMLFTDTIIKNILEFSLSKTLRKDVYIQKIDSSFSNLNLSIYKTQIDDFQIDKIYLKLSWDYLLWKKFDITDLIIQNMHTNKSIASLINKEKTSQIDNSNKNNINFSFKIPDASTILANYQLKTIKKIKKLKKDYNNLKNLIASINNDIKANNDSIKQIKEQINKLEIQSKNITNAQDIQNIISQVEKIKNNINSLKTSIDKYKSQLTKSKEIITKDLKEIKMASKEDYTKLSSQYNMIKNNEYLKFTQTILKPEISKYINQAIMVYNKIKPYIKKEKEPEYIRGKGINIKFKDNILYPDFVLKLAKINGKFSDSSFKIIIHNITNNQKLLNKQTTAIIDSNSKYYKSLKINLAFFINKFNITTKLSKLHLDSIQKNNILLQNPIINLTSITKINNDNINSTSNFIITTSKIKYIQNKMISNALSNIKHINIKTAVIGQIQKFDLKIESNIDNIVKSALNKIITLQINKQKNKLKTLLNKQISAQLKDINLNIIDNTNQNLDLQQNSLNSLKSYLNKYSKEYLSKKLLKKGVMKFF